MTLTCPHCLRTISILLTGPRYEVRTACPGCGCKIVVEVGASLRVFEGDKRRTLRVWRGATLNEVGVVG